jgi:ABC-type transport system involved in cytochrome c biogenesis permease subunit
MDEQNSTGAAGGVRSLLRLEGAALLAAALILYAQAGAPWRLFFILFLAPDLAFAFYAFGARAGAFAYNATHSTLGPFLLAMASQIDLTKFGLAHGPALLPIAFIWFAHVGFDRALGYGLKYASGFSDTHLGAIGRKRRAAI